ncbi:unnamed protein product [Blepharisma stoltei]|uniref:Uncharacterized protein n=1 Tax=Blepharisma stoltei TaxID=1481888 RepID=A0AAU9J3M1_9CILI|nr:unnamed protein product [Blepharisma stoltei]
MGCGAPTRPLERQISLDFNLPKSVEDGFQLSFKKELLKKKSRKSLTSRRNQTLQQTKESLGTERPLEKIDSEVLAPAILSEQVITNSPTKIEVKENAFESPVKPTEIYQVIEANKEIGIQEENYVFVKKFEESHEPIQEAGENYGFVQKLEESHEHAQEIEENNDFFTKVDEESHDFSKKFGIRAGEEDLIEGSSFNSVDKEIQEELELNKEKQKAIRVEIEKQAAEEAQNIVNAKRAEMVAELERKRTERERIDNDMKKILSKYSDVISS